MRIRSCLIRTLSVMVMLFYANITNALNDPDDDRLIYWNGCSGADAECDPIETWYGKEDHIRNTIYEDIIGKSVVKILAGGGACTGLYIGERFVATAAHCLFIGGYPDPDTVQVYWGVDDFSSTPINFEYRSGIVGYFSPPISDDLENNDYSYTAYIGTKSETDISKFMDVIDNRYQCFDGQYDIAILVLNNRHRRNGMIEDQEVRPFYNSNYEWHQQPHWTYNNNIDNQWALIFGSGYSEWNGIYDQEGDMHLRGHFQYILNEYSKMFTIDSFNSIDHPAYGYATYIQGGDSGGPVFIPGSDPFVDQPIWIGVVSGSGIKPWDTGEEGVFYNTIAACSGGPEAFLTCALPTLLIMGDTETCFTNLQDPYTKWYIVDKLENLDDDMDGFLTRDSYATDNDPDFINILKRSENWIDEPRWASFYDKHEDNSPYPPECNIVPGPWKEPRLWDNCPAKYNPDQVDNDCDHVGDVCDNCPETFNPFQENSDNDPYGDACDNCPQIRNIAERDLNGDDIIDWKDQWDLDGDGHLNYCSLNDEYRTDPGCEGDPTHIHGGDHCDIDLDGDNDEIRYMPEDYYKDINPDYNVSEPDKVPPGDCAPFLWTMTLDKDGDAWCDLYNFVGYTKLDRKGVCEIVPEAEFWVPRWGKNREKLEPHGYFRVMPGGSELKPYDVPVSIDHFSGHYPRSGYKYLTSLGDEWGWVSWDGRTINPGEDAYSWLHNEKFDCDGSTVDNINHGYRGCLTNLMDVWHYYGGAAIATGNPPTAKFDGFPVDAGYPNHGRPPVPEGFDEIIAYRDPVTGLEFTLKDAFNRLLNPNICNVDNCIRFSISDIDTKIPDPLSNNIMYKDNGDIQKGTKETNYCWTMNKENVSLLDTYIECNDANNDILNYDDPNYSPYISPGYINYYFNPDQTDSNHDGVGDKCSAIIDINNLKQYHGWDPQASGTFTKETWPEYVSSNLEYREGYQKIVDVSESNKEYEVRRAYNPFLGTYTYKSELSSLCDNCERICKIERRKLHAAQRLEFDVNGFSLSSQATNIGACSCKFYEEIDCYNQDDKCWHPQDDLRDSPDLQDIAIYMSTAYYSEHDGNTGRPRFSGLRFWANNPGSYWESKKVADVCSNSLIYVFGTYLPYGWDNNPVPVADGCNEIAMNFINGDHKSLYWRYMGQVEPDPTVTGFNINNLEQRWSDGHRTRMRLAISKGAHLQYSTPVWYKQWHSSTDDWYVVPYWETEDHLRPIPESIIGKEDIVVFERTECKPDPLVIPPIPIPEIPPINPGTKPGVIFSNVTTTIDTLSILEDKIEAKLKVISQGNGEINSSNISRNIDGNTDLFPVDGFSWITMVFSESEAIRLFNYDEGHNPFKVDLVIGGILKNGEASPYVWIAKKWEEGMPFRILPVNNPISVIGPSLVYDNDTYQLYLVGGYNESGTRIDRVWSFDIENKEWKNTWESAPEGLMLNNELNEASISLDNLQNQAYLLSESEQGMKIFLFKTSLYGPELREISTNSLTPENRSLASVTYHQDTGEIVMFGGMDPTTGQAMNDLWIFSPSTGVWSEYEFNDEMPTPVARWNAHLIAGANGKIMLFGGENEQETDTENSVWSFGLYPGEEQWMPSTSPEQFAELIVDGSEVLGSLVKGEPKTYRLIMPTLDGYNGQLIKINISNPENNLYAYAYSGTSGITYSSPETESNLSIMVHKGEEWYIAISERMESNNSYSGMTFSIQAETAMLTDSLKKIPVHRCTRFDVEGDIICVANWNKLDIYQRENAYDECNKAKEKGKKRSCSQKKCKKTKIKKTGKLRLSSAVDVIVEKEIAYIADATDGLIVADISDPKHPLVIGSDWTLGPVDSIAKSGDRVYLGAGLLGVLVIDVSNPDNPVWIDTISTSDVVVDVSIGGNVLMVSGLLGALEIYSIDAEGVISSTGTYYPQGWVEDTAIYASNIYMGKTNDDVEVVDIRTPSDPQLIDILLSAGNNEVAMRIGYDFAVMPGMWHDLMVYEIDGYENSHHDCHGDDDND